MPKYWALGAALAVSIGLPLAAVAEDVTVPDEYAKLIQQHSRITALEGGFFGDHVSLSTGGLEFVQTDIDLPGNNALDVRVGRRLEVGGGHQPGHFGDWDLDIPHLHGVFGAPLSWNNWVGTDGSTNRCTQFGPPPDVTYQYGTFGPDEYWHGSFLYLPGSGDQELLYTVGAQIPSDGRTYPAVSREGAAVRCLPAIAPTSEANGSGEGFEVVTPDGVVYTFDQMVSRNDDGLKKSDPAPLLQAAGASPRNSATRTPPGTRGLGESTQAAAGYVLPRREVFLYPTKVTDRFGNTVTYTWSSSNPWRLLQISASDGRHLDFTYPAADPASYQVQTVSDGTRTWTYTATTMVQPDGGTWQFNLHDLAFFAKPHPVATCDTMSSAGGSWSGTITAPSGATAQYNVAGTAFGRSWVVRQCVPDATYEHETAREPYLFASIALTSKTITGPGLPSGGLTWTYAYGAPNHCWNPSGVPTSETDAVLCTGASTLRRTTTVTEPDGAVSRYAFGNRYGVDEGVLYTEEHGVNGASAMRSRAIAYGALNAAPYAAYNGASPRARGDFLIAGQRRPQLSVTTTQQGQSFSWSVPQACGGNFCFDNRARPTVATREGPNGTARTEATTYYDNLTLWVLGQVSQVACTAPTAPLACSSSGTVTATTFDPSTALPLSTSAFGKLKNTFTYDLVSALSTGQRGTLKTVKDGNNNISTYTNWKRGIPQSVVFADGASRTAVVDDRGWITSVTDENGFATAYYYDAMGRITQVRYPDDQGVTWNTTDSKFELVGTAEQGVAAGHWRERVQTGDGYKVTLFDALWRPVLVHEYDWGASGTDRWVSTAYDKAGRVVDVSYPVGTTGSGLTMAITADTATWKLGSTRPPGVRTSYDALGRPTSVKQDSELGVLETKTEYLAGFQRRVTDARNNATTEQFMAWDSPTFDLPIQIDAPEGQRTTIARDVFGKPTTITRGATP